MGDEVGWCDAVLIGRRSTNPTRDVNLTMQLADLLSNSLVRPVKDSTTERNGMVRFHVVCCHCRKL